MNAKARRKSSHLDLTQVRPTDFSGGSNFFLGEPQFKSSHPELIPDPSGIRIDSRHLPQAQRPLMVPVGNANLVIMDDINVLEVPEQWLNLPKKHQRYGSSRSQTFRSGDSNFDPNFVSPKDDGTFPELDPVHFTFFVFEHSATHCRIRATPPCLRNALRFDIFRQMAKGASSKGQNLLRWMPPC